MSEDEDVAFGAALDVGHGAPLALEAHRRLDAGEAQEEQARAPARPRRLFPCRARRTPEDHQIIMRVARDSKKLKQRQVETLALEEAIVTAAPHMEVVPQTSSSRSSLRRALSARLKGNPDKQTSFEEGMAQAYSASASGAALAKVWGVSTYTVLRNMLGLAFFFDIATHASAVVDARAC